jgi:sugar/nucleoside kinase (ribokinase family)
MQDNKLSNMQEPRSLSSVEQKKILGLGVACIDMMTCVDIYPKQDEKILANSTGIYSGGNVGNTLTTISLLKAASATIFTKIGDDSNGKFFLKDLHRVGVDVTHVLTNACATRFVYIIVDRQGCRTCIASPNEQEMTVSEVKNAVYTDNKNDLISGLLENVEVCYYEIN